MFFNILQLNNLHDKHKIYDMKCQVKMYTQTFRQLTRHAGERILLVLLI